MFVKIAFDDVTSAPSEEYDFFSEPSITVSTSPPPPVEQNESDPVGNAVSLLQKQHPGSDSQLEYAGKLLKNVEKLPEIKKIHWHALIRDIMGWSKRDLDRVLKELRGKWYSEREIKVNFFGDTIYVAEQNRFFDRKKRLWLTPEGYQNTYAHLDSEARKSALQEGRVAKVDRIDYAPKKPAIFEEKGIIYGNAWEDLEPEVGRRGDASPWLDHFDTLGWGAYRDHVLKWMAWTILHPDIKINHMIIFGGHEGCGKDWLLYPLVQAMGRDHAIIDGSALLRDFNEYLLCAKHIHINEAELGDRNEAKMVSNKLKPMAAAPPHKLSVNPKGATPVWVRNIHSVTMTTNSQKPIELNGQSRRILALWSDLKTRDNLGNTRPEWNEYWRKAWNWMELGGWQHCVWYLRNRVDLSDFSPGAPPPATDFLRDIVSTSRSPLHQTLEVLIDDRIGMFTNDLITVREIMQSISLCESLHPELVFVRSDRLTPTTVILALKSLGDHIPVRGEKAPDGSELWIIRNHDHWRHYRNEELHQAYLVQMKKYKHSTPLKEVNS